MAAGASAAFTPAVGALIKGTSWYFDIDGKIGDLGGAAYFHYYASNEVAREENEKLEKEANELGFISVQSYLLWKHRNGTFVLPSHKTLHFLDYLFGPRDPDIDGPVDAKLDKINQKKTELDPEWNKEKDK